MKEINVREIKENAVKMISDDWMLVTAGDDSGFNTMTASWGGIGELWAKDVVFVFIRPQRYTLEFIEKNDVFSLSFFGGDYKKELTFCGRNSGRDVDKMKETNFTPVFSDGTTYFEEAETVLICKKLAVTEITPDSFIDKDIDKNYANKDYHKVFIAEIVKTLKK
ncbi:MAG: flavin reductase family protein [Ruminococcaceae bacterium]|nr:flavin reductase family protein [Oscillospiraceae bacterium]